MYIEKDMAYFMNILFSLPMLYIFLPLYLIIVSATSTALGWANAFKLITLLFTAAFLFVTYVVFILTTFSPTEYYYVPVP